MKNETKNNIMAIFLCASLMGFGGSCIAFILNNWILGIILLVSFIILFTMFIILSEIEDCPKQSKEKLEDIKPEDFSKYIKLEDLPQILKRLDGESGIFEDILRNKKLNRYTEIDFSQYAKIEDLKRRDYLVNTKFLGNLKNKKLIDEFKQSFKGYLISFEIEVIPGTTKINSYNILCDEIKQYYFTHLDIFIRTLQRYEDKQKTIDEYKEEELCKKNAETSKNLKS